MGRIRVGISGWTYPHWRGAFYPESLRPRDELAFVGERFDTVEVNSTFYRLGKPDTFRRWYRSVPAGFVFAVKGGRFITHNKKLAGVDAALANFFASGVLELADKLGPILWQLPESLRFDSARIEAFLAMLPRNTPAAVELARGHDRLSEVAYGPGGKRRIRHVLEVRHTSFLCREMVAIARRHGAALAFSHSAAWPYVEEITAGFIYLRFHGPAQLYASRYGTDELRRWKARIAQWQQGVEPSDAIRITSRPSPARKSRDVYVYFDNDHRGFAPREAGCLQTLFREA